MKTEAIRRVLLEHREFILTLPSTDPLRRVCDLATVTVLKKDLTTVPVRRSLNRKPLHPFESRLALATESQSVD